MTNVHNSLGIKNMTKWQEHTQTHIQMYARATPDAHGECLHVRSRHQQPRLNGKGHTHTHTQEQLQTHMVNAYMYGQDTNNPDRVAKSWEEVDDLLQSLSDPYTRRVNPT